ncbi:kinase-like domain-containing protein [Rhizophagus irregularis DAOM 181602=DAOM 197198]|nr:kinase-like domain-containing protein [Rhizophagus irregularis DAOM 181602=DAOM 197198]CAG8443825.1 13310_t:CDS:2 [Rhizophagus irregularis]
MIASQPFSAGVEKYTYFAFSIKSDPTKEMVMKEYLRVEDTTIDVRTRYYTIEPKLQNAECKRFNANSDVIIELRPTLETFAHFTYDYTYY